jgi:hypothetical protein
MATNGSYEIHAAARGPHWIAWVSLPGSQQPARSIILVAATQEEALTRARAWASSAYNLPPESDPGHAPGRPDFAG